MNILITGGNGFLGSSVVKKLIKENHNVLVLSKKNNNIKSIINNCKFLPYYIDEPENYIKDIQLFSPDVILLFGWWGSNNRKDVNNMNQYYKNIPSHIKFLELINKFSYKTKIIGVGSFAEYGSYEIPITEECVEKPNNLYGLSKLTFKKYSEMFCNQNNIKWAWIRPCFIYGPNDVKTRLIPTVIGKCLKNENVELDECNKIIDYLYIDNFADIVYEIIHLNLCGVYNVCSGNKYPLRSIIDLIVKLTNTNSKIVYNKNINVQENNNVICGDNEKIKKYINDLSLLCIEDGMEKTIKFYD